MDEASGTDHKSRMNHHRDVPEGFVTGLGTDDGQAAQDYDDNLPVFNM